VRWSVSFVVFSNTTYGHGVSETISKVSERIFRPSSVFDCHGRATWRRLLAPLAGVRGAPTVVARFHWPHAQRLYRNNRQRGRSQPRDRHFYSSFHSVRYTRDELIIRLQRLPRQEQFDAIAQRFADIRVSGRFRLCDTWKRNTTNPLWPICLAWFLLSIAAIKLGNGSSLMT
jgi:hypothetical protein